MSKETLELCLQAIDQSKIKTVDLTGGAPNEPPFSMVRGGMPKAGCPCHESLQFGSIITPTNIMISRSSLKESC
ncbi:MAG: hypothetical protein R2827_10950 [Bdellovibrionales bacterium]